MGDWNDDLEVMESFVLEGKRFIRLPDEEVCFHCTIFVLFPPCCSVKNKILKEVLNIQIFLDLSAILDLNDLQRKLRLVVINLWIEKVFVQILSSDNLLTDLFQYSYIHCI